MIRPGVYRLGDNVEVSGVFYDSSGAIMQDADEIKFYFLSPANQLFGPFFVPFIANEAFLDFELDQNPESVGEWKLRMECGSPKAAVIEKKFLVVPNLE